MNNKTHGDAAGKQDLGQTRKEQSKPHRSSGCRYEIRIRDHLDTYWYEWFEGWTITNLENGEAIMHSALIDQSALHGALNKICDLNLTILLVICLDELSAPRQGEEHLIS